MKRYMEMDQTELGEVTDDQVETLVELEIAFAGIKPVEPPGDFKALPLSIHPTEVAYRVGGLLFANRSDAESVAGLSLFTEEYQYELGYDLKYLSPLQPKVTAESFYKLSDLLAARKDIIEAKENKERFEPAKRAYEKYISSTSSLRRQVLDAVHAARGFKRRVDTARVHLEKFKKLADGNEDIARKFFADAFKDEPEVANAVIPGVLPNN